MCPSVIKWAWLFHFRHHGKYWNRTRPVALDVPQCDQMSMIISFSPSWQILEPNSASDVRCAPVWSNEHDYFIFAIMANTGTELDQWRQMCLSVIKWGLVTLSLSKLNLISAILEKTGTELGQWRQMYHLKIIVIKKHPYMVNGSKYDLISKKNWLQLSWGVRATTGQGGSD